MEHNTGYLITHQNHDAVAHITGFPPEVIAANIGWVAIFLHTGHAGVSGRPHWLLIPKTVAEEDSEFRYIKTRLDEVPVATERTLEDIDAERSQLRTNFHTRMRELDREELAIKERE